jgi:hypothetical protein
MIDKAEAFKSLIDKCWFSQIRDVGSGTDLLKIIRHPQGPMTEADFKWHLADAILNKRFSVEEYERLTDFDFETREEVAADLVQLWGLVFGQEPIAMPTKPTT